MHGIRKSLSAASTGNINDVLLAHEIGRRRLDQEAPDRGKRLAAPPLREAAVVQDADYDGARGVRIRSPCRVEKRGREEYPDDVDYDASRERLCSPRQPRQPLLSSTLSRPCVEMLGSSKSAPKEAEPVDLVDDERGEEAPIVFLKALEHGGVYSFFGKVKGSSEWERLDQEWVIAPARTRALAICS